MHARAPVKNHRNSRIWRIMNCVGVLMDVLRVWTRNHQPTAKPWIYINVKTACWYDHFNSNARVNSNSLSSRFTSKTTIRIAHNQYIDSNKNKTTSCVNSCVLMVFFFSFWFNSLWYSRVWCVFWFERLVNIINR